MSELDLNACDRERIHEIGMVQAYGALVAFNADLRIQIVSENLAEVAGISGQSDSFLGAHLGSVLDANLAEEISDRLAFLKVASTRQAFESRGQKSFDLYLFKMGEGLYGLELCPLAPGAVGYEIPAFDEFVRKAKGARSVEDLGELACRTVRKITGMDRVMLYRFYPPSWFGEVIAEDRVAEAHSFQDHRFPASDIPKPARDLYLRNQVRLIVDAQGADARIHREKANARAVDLSDSRLRSVSRVHLEYLKNMGVRGSFSVAVMVDNTLWGLIACHSPRATYISHATRAVCESVANTVALFAPLTESNIQQGMELEFGRRLQRLFESLRLSPDPREHLLRSVQEVLELFRAQGLAIIEAGKVDFAGLTPTRADLLVLGQQLRDRMQELDTEILSISSLASLDPRWEDIKDQASGVLAILSPEAGGALCLLFRPEHLRTVQWAGDPRKQVESRNYQGPINPRVSFETWTETLRNSSEPWLGFEEEGAKNFRNMVFDSLIRRERLIQDFARGRT